MWLYHRVMSPKDEGGMAISVDPDQTAPLIWVYTICPGLSVRKLRIIMVYKKDSSHSGGITSCAITKSFGGITLAGFNISLQLKLFSGYQHRK